LNDEIEKNSNQNNKKNKYNRKKIKKDEICKKYSFLKIISNKTDSNDDQIWLIKIKGGKTNWKDEIEFFFYFINYFK